MGGGGDNLPIGGSGNPLIGTKDPNQYGYYNPPAQANNQIPQLGSTGWAATHPNYNAAPGTQAWGATHPDYKPPQAPGSVGSTDWAATHPDYNAAPGTPAWAATHPGYKPPAQGQPGQMTNQFGLGGGGWGQPQAQAQQLAGSNKVPGQ